MIHYFNPHCTRLTPVNHISFVLGNPELDMILQMRPHQCWREKDPFPHTAGNALTNVVQQASALFFHEGCVGSSWSSGFPFPESLHSKDSSSKAISSQWVPSMYWRLGLFLHRYKGLPLPLLKLRFLPACSPASQLGWKAAQPLAHQPVCPVCIIWEPAEGAQCSFVQISHKYGEQYQPQY